MTTGRKIKLKRSTADGYVEDIRRRIHEVNSDDSFCYRITRAVIFGSYVNEPEKTMLGDLDVALKLEPRYEGPEMEEHEKAARDTCPETYGYMEWLGWPREVVLRYVRNRRAYVSIHRIGHDDEAIFSKKWVEIL